MTDWLNISDDTPRRAYVATAAQTAFTFPFQFFEESDLVVYVNDVLKTLSTDYITSGALSDTGGSVTFNVAMSGGESVVITSTLAYDLTTHIPPSGPLDVPAINIQFSRFVAMIKQVVANGMRSLVQPASDVTDFTALPIATTRASKYLFFDATGQPTVVASVSTSVAASAFILTLMDDTTAAQARATLGVTDQSSYSGLSNWNFFR